MKIYTLGQKVRVGGKRGYIATIAEIKPNGEMILVSDNGMCTYYYQPGDCTLYKVKEYEQLTLF